MMESMSGSGHCFNWKRERLGDKAELYRFDPFGELMHASSISGFFSK
jgi:hypothetical protein